MLQKIYTLGMLLFFVLLCLSVGQTGIFFATEDAYRWYQLLHKPTWTPPNIVFPVAWTLLYVLIGLSAWLVWRLKKQGYRKALIFWSIQLFLNAIWTPLFFGYQEILWSFLVIDCLWLFILMTAILFYRQSKLATFFMLIYLAWVTFAGILNFSIWQMNIN